MKQYLSHYPSIFIFFFLHFLVSFQLQYAENLSLKAQKVKHSFWHENASSYTIPGRMSLCCP